MLSVDGNAQHHTCFINIFWINGTSASLEIRKFNGKNGLETMKYVTLPDINKV